MNNTYTQTQFKAFKAYEIKLLALKLECFNLGFDLTIKNNGYFEIYTYNAVTPLVTVERFDQVQAYILANSTINYNYKLNDLFTQND
tara:strand:- start:6524 stop:6784 length:261 start_codon:yes stop_codon:yes gene_type:complete